MWCILCVLQLYCHLIVTGSRDGSVTVWSCVDGAAGISSIRALCLDMFASRSCWNTTSDVTKCDRGFCVGSDRSPRHGVRVTTTPWLGSLRSVDAGDPSGADARNDVLPLLVFSKCWFDRADAHTPVGDYSMLVIPVLANVKLHAR